MTQFSRRNGTQGDQEAYEGRERNLTRAADEASRPGRIRYEAPGSQAAKKEW